MNSHFQSSATTSTSIGFTDDSSGLYGSAVRGLPREHAEEQDDQRRHRPDHDLDRGRVRPVRRVGGVAVRRAVTPREPQREQDHRHDDDQHRPGGRRDQRLSAAPTLPFGFSTSKLQPDRLKAAPIDISATPPLKLFFSSHSPRVIESVCVCRCAFDPRKWPNHTSRECDENQLMRKIIIAESAVRQIVAGNFTQPEAGPALPAPDRDGIDARATTAPPCGAPHCARRAAISRASMPCTTAAAAQGRPLSAASNGSRLRSAVPRSDRSRR